MDSEFILLNDFTCHETGLHNADRFHRMIRLGSVMQYKTQAGRLFGKPGMSLMTTFDIYAIMHLYRGGEDWFEFRNWITLSCIDCNADLTGASRMAVIVFQYNQNNIYEKQNVRNENMNRAKKFPALVLLLLALTVTGRGNDKEQDASADREKTGASDTIGAGADTSVSLGEALVITAAKMETEPGRNKVYVDIENITENDVYIEWLDLTIDGQAASKDSSSKFQYWFPDEWSRKIKAGNTSQEIFYIDHPTVPNIEYAEMLMEATVSDSDKTQTEFLKATISIKDIETVDATGNMPEATAAPDSDDPLAAGMAAYREVVSHADTYEEAYVEPGSSTGDYHYALVLVQPHHDVPALLVKQDGDTGLNIVKVFQYSPQTGTIFEVQGLIPEGVDNLDRHMSLYVPTDQRSIIYNEYHGGSGYGSTRRYTFGSGGFEDDPKLFLQSSGLWSSVDSGSKTDTSVEETGRVEIEWYDITDMTGLDNGKPTGE